MSGVSPCPFCGSAGQHVYMNHAGDPHYRIVCTNRDCDAQGPRAPIMSDEDTKKWNARDNSPFLELADMMEEFKPRSHIGPLHGAGMASAYQEAARLIRNLANP